MLSSIIKYRNKHIAELSEEGYTYADIGRYFEISPSEVAKVLGKDLTLTPEQISHSKEKIENKLRERDLRISQITCDLELYLLGFYFKPGNNLLAEKVATEYWGPESDDKEYNLLFELREVWKARNLSGHQSSTSFNLALRNKGFDSNTIIARGKKHKKITDLALYWELYADGFSIPEIVSYIGDTNETKVGRTIATAKEYGIEKNSCERNIKALLLEGHKDKNIALYLGITPYLVTEKKKELINLPDKNSKRQELIYHLNFDKHMSQTEIAEILFLTRGTVNTDLQAYLQAHPDKTGHDIKMRYVPVDSTHASTTTDFKDKIISLRLQGHSVASIVKITQVKEHAVLKLIQKEEHTPGTELYNKIHTLQQQVEKLKSEGKSIKETALILGVKGQSIRKFYKN